MQCYRLKDNYVLRGWDKLPYAVVNTSAGITQFLSLRQFQAVQLCNGDVDFSVPSIPEDFRHMVSEMESFGIVEQCESGKGLTSYQQYRKYPSRYIRSVKWAITGRCNDKCRHCHMSAPEPNYCELPHESMMEIVNQLAECGVMRVRLTGGEPLLRPDFLEIVEALSERNIFIEAIQTNGALVDEKLLRELELMGVRPEFYMSYDGMGWHDWMRGIAGAEKAVNRAFALCRDMGFETAASMALHKGNIHTLRDSINHLASLGVGQINTAHVASIGEWKTRSDNHSLTYKELFQAYTDYIPHYYEDGMPMRVFFLSFWYVDPDKPDKYDIAAYEESYDPEKTLLYEYARIAPYISSEGRVLLSSLFARQKIEKEFSSLLEKSFAECVASPEYRHFADMKVSDFLKANAECRECRFSKHCYAGSRDNAFSEDEDNLMAKSPFLCELYYGGWVKRIVDAVRKARPSAECPVRDVALL